MPKPGEANSEYKDPLQVKDKTNVGGIKLTDEERRRRLVVVADLETKWLEANPEKRQAAIKNSISVMQACGITDGMLAYNSPSNIYNGTQTPPPLSLEEELTQRQEDAVDPNAPTPPPPLERDFAFPLRADSESKALSSVDSKKIQAPLPRRASRPIILHLEDSKKAPPARSNSASSSSSSSISIAVVGRSMSASFSKHIAPSVAIDQRPSLARVLSAPLSMNPRDARKKRKADDKKLSNEEGPSVSTAKRQHI